MGLGTARGHEGIRAGLIGATGAWLSYAAGDLLSGTPFRTLAVLGRLFGAAYWGPILTSTAVMVVTVCLCAAWMGVGAGAGSGGLGGRGWGGGEGGGGGVGGGWGGAAGVGGRVSGGVPRGREPRRSIPAFARKYGMKCSACHFAVPVLNHFGQAFK